MRGRRAGIINANLKSGVEWAVNQNRPILNTAQPTTIFLKQESGSLMPPGLLFKN
jgi:hypothetical protein